MLQGYFLEDLKTGMTAERHFCVREEDVQAFADVSGDHNPIHLDQEYAKSSVFEKRVVHGALVASYISGVLGNDLPGPGAIFVGMNIRFRRPVFIDDTVTARVEVAEIDERLGRVVMKVSALVGRKRTMGGEAFVRVKKRLET